MKNLFKILAVLTLMLSSVSGFCAELEEDAEMVITDYSAAFWILIVVGAFLLIAILAFASSVKNYAGSDLLAKRLKDRAGKSGMILLLLVPGSAMAEGAGSVQEWIPSAGDVWFVAVIDIILFFGFLYMARLYKDLLASGAPDEAPAVLVEKEQPSFVQRILTQTVPIEEEESILMDHEYDGIQELDNRLPPWWLWGFYISIAFSVVYLFHYHVFGTGDLQMAEYNKDMEAAQLAQAEFLSGQALNVDENTVTLLLDDADLKAGKKVYTKHCQVCHAAQGQGQVGPNFTDDYWIYGNSPKEVFKTIKYGAKRGMKAWDKDVNPMEMAQVTSFIISLQGTEVVGGKDAEGDYYAPYDPASEATETEGEEGAEGDDAAAVDGSEESTPEDEGTVETEEVTDGGETE